MKRIMIIKYPKNKELIDRLKTCFDMCSIKYVIFDNYFYYEIHIDKNTCTWEQVKREVNRVKATKFSFVNDEKIEVYNGKYTVFVNCGVIAV